MAAAIETIIIPPARDLGSFAVRRALPSPQRAMVGPFVFWDLAGPAPAVPGRGVDVRPHPHIGLATLTWLFDGALVHRDSLGTIQRIEPGAVNLMTAGRGIMHSERTPLEGRAAGLPFFAAQAWLALPRLHETGPPDFAHLDGRDVPQFHSGAMAGRLIAGELLGLHGTLAFPWPVLLAEITLGPGGTFPVPARYAERAVHVVSGTAEIDGHRAEPGTMVVLAGGPAVQVRAADGPVRLMLLGGATMDGPRHLWWNFVASSPAMIRAAANGWAHDRAAWFGTIATDAQEFIPLPATGLP